MEHSQAQKRMLICAAFFSFGTLCGALSFLQLSVPASMHIWELVFGFVARRPLLLVPAAFCAAPLLLLVFGFSASGFVFSDLILTFAGFVSAFAVGMLLRFTHDGFLCSAFLWLACLCLVVTAASVRRLSFLIRTQIRSGGLLRPDYAYDALRISVCFSVILLAAFALAYYILSV
jgi:hypothetical protein